jgi:hypothetical protein
MLNRIIQTAVPAVALTLFGFVSSVNAAATLTLTKTAGSGPITPGALVQVQVSMSGLTTTPAAGFQAFLHYDNTRLQFINGAYTPGPFGLAVIAPVTATPGGDIDIASGINQFAGQTPTLADAPLAYLTFISINGACDETSVQFRPHNPPSRITALNSVNIVPLTLIGLLPLPVTCPADLDHNNTVDIDDLVIVITHWGRCPPQPPDCCLGDIVFPLGVGDHTVNIDDLVALITSWGPCPP